MENERRWEDLKIDCLVNVFQRVGMEPLLLDVPFVCKSWYKASLDPSCWKQLIFPDFEPDPFGFEPYPIYQRFLSEYRVDEDRFSVTDFIKSMVDRSRGNAISLKLPGCCKLEEFEYAADTCPNLGILALPRYLLYDSRLNVELIGKWKNLFMLSLGCCNNLEKILATVGMNCKYFSHLILSNNASIEKKEALAIVNLVPNIKLLSLERASIQRDGLVVILQGCKNLEFLDARNCIGFKEDDEEISQLGSHIRNFMRDGSVERFELFSDFNFEDVFASLNEDDINNMASMFAEISVDEEEADQNIEGVGDTVSI